MENKEQNNLDRLSKKILIEASKEETSFDFTSQVMNQIEVASKKTLVYKPLIPKVVWLIILCTLTFWLGYLFKNHFIGNSSWFPTFSLSNLFSDFQLSKSATYTIILFAFMVCVQVPLLKHYFDKRLGT